MAEIKNTPQLEQTSEEPLNLYALFFKFFAYWPWFIVSIVGCLLLAFIYLRYQTPVYNISASVLIKEQDARSKAMMGTNGALGALQDIGGFSMGGKMTLKMSAAYPEMFAEAKIGVIVGSLLSGILGWAILKKSLPEIAQNKVAQ